MTTASAAADAAPRRFRVKCLDVEVHRDNESMGRAAAAAVADAIRQAAETREIVRMILGSANSQVSFINALTRQRDLPWNRIVCFHMDEYLGIGADHPASFRRWMRERVVEAVRPAAFHMLNGDAADPGAEAERYGRLLAAAPVDITCLGIGENGHLAFNDPPFADFNDPLPVKIVALDEQSRRQQVGERHFPTLSAVPTHALTVTIPVLLSARRIFGIVPESRKAEAVRLALEGPVTTECPASILREKSNAVLFLDEASAGRLRLPVSVSNPVRG